MGNGKQLCSSINQAEAQILQLTQKVWVVEAHLGHGYSHHSTFLTKRR